jgi:tissue factor pathway inhibitor
MHIAKVNKSQIKQFKLCYATHINLSQTGPCKAYIKSFFYNSSTNKCEFFVYGGCDGNENRFSSLEECKFMCELPLSQ